MRITFIILTILFLFGGMILLGIYSGHDKNDGNTGVYATNLSRQAQSYDEGLTIKQIDSLTANLNLPFTSVNGKGISPAYVVK